MVDSLLAESLTVDSLLAELLTVDSLLAESLTVDSLLAESLTELLVSLVLLATVAAVQLLAKALCEHSSLVFATCLVAETVDVAVLPKHKLLLAVAALAVDATKHS